MATSLFWFSALGYLIGVKLITGDRDFLREFKRDWCRERQVRQDWHSIAKTCRGRSRQWGFDKWPNSLRTSANFSYISWVDPKPAGQFTKIHIQTVTIRNTTKLIGGDWWRVKVKGPSSVAGSVYDFGNGTYEVVLLLSEPGTYTAQLTLDYTLCHGSKNPPNDWFKRGCRHGSFQREGSLGSENDYINQVFRFGSMITITVSDAPTRTEEDFSMVGFGSREWCPENCTLVWDGFGRWLNGQWQPYLESVPIPQSGHVAGTGVLWIYGDSVNRFFYEALTTRPLCTQVFRACHYTPVWVYLLKGGPHQEMDRSYGGHDLNVTFVTEELSSVIRQPIMDKNSALLLNIGIHFLKSTVFRDYQKIIKGMISVLQKYYRGSVVWKTTTALGEQTHLYSGCARRFHTEQRIKLFNAYATKKMCQAGYGVLDVYPLSSGFPEGSYDGVHHRARVFYPAEKALEMFFRNP